METSVPEDGSRSSDFARETETETESLSGAASVATEPKVTDIALHMLKEGICPSCVLRFSSHRYPESYKNPRAALLGNFFKLPEEKVPDSKHQNPCPVCLGILQRAATQNFVAEVVSTVESENRKFSNFSLSTILPIQVIIRSRCYWAYLKTLFKKFQGQLYDVACPLIKDVLKWSCLAHLIDGLKVPYKVDSMMDITLTFTHESTDSEWEFLKQMDPDRFRPKKYSRGGRNRRHLQEPPKPAFSHLVASLTQYESKLSRYAPCPPEPVNTPCKMPTVTCLHVPVFVAGRYMKYSRTLSQTPWVIDGERKGTTSVEELLTKELKENFIATDVKFSASGREDIDVRMLGTGRPFIVELSDPRVEELSASVVRNIQKQVNNSRANTPVPLVKVRDLQIVEKVDTTVLKEGEEKKTKTYLCVIWLSRDIDEAEFHTLTDLKDLVTYQRTPIRVMHRRNVAVREKTIHWTKLEKIKPHFYRLWLNTEAGAYVKEFVHGDFGRTVPNVGTILDCQADILSLDVIEVGLAWPPYIDPT